MNPLYTLCPLLFFTFLAVFSSIHCKEYDSCPYCDGKRVSNGKKPYSEGCGNVANLANAVLSIGTGLRSFWNKFMNSENEKKPEILGRALGVNHQESLSQVVGRALGVDPEKESWTNIVGRAWRDPKDRQEKTDHLKKSVERAVETGVKKVAEHVENSPMSKCCDGHSLCYASCTNTRDGCDQELQKCLNDYRQGRNLTDPEKLLEKSLLDLTKSFLGCKLYHNRQKEFCTCKE